MIELLEKLPCHYMSEQLNRGMIRQQEILFSREQVVLSTVDDLKGHIRRRERLFLSRLGSISLSMSKQPGDITGWEDISNGNGLIRKKTGIPSQDGIFTGSGLCFIASFALLEGLSLTTNSFSFDQAGFFTDMHAENWGNDRYNIQPLGHYIVRATQQDSGEKVFLDPTYAQVDHRAAGRIAIIGEDQLNHYYRNSRGINPKYEAMPSYIDWLGITKEQYVSLVAAIS